MLNSLKDTAKHTFIYSLGNMSTKIIGLILLPLYTAKLSLLNYGKFTILEVIGTFTAMIFGLRIVSAMIRWYSEQDDIQKQKSIIFTSYTTLVFVVILLNLTLFPFQKEFSKLFFGSYKYAKFFRIIFLIAAFEILNQIPFNILRLKEKSFSYILIFSGRLIVVLAMNIYFLVYAEIGVIGIFYSQLISNILVFLLTLPLLLRNINFSFDLKLLQKMFGYSFPLIFSAISVQLLSIGDRFIIKYLMDYQQVGIYSLGYKIAGVLNVLVVQSFALGFLPIAFKMFKSPDAKIFYIKIFKYFSMILVFGALILSLFSREALQIFASKPEFRIAYKIVPLLTLTFVFKGIQYMFSLGLQYVKKTKYIAYVVSVGVIMNFTLNFILIPTKLGIFGAGIATLISSVFITFALYFISNKYYKVDYEIGKMFLVMIIGGILFILSIPTSGMNIYLRIGTKMVLFVSYPFMLYFFRFYETTELDKMKKYLIKWQNKFISQK